jgi:phenylacetate-CoA ligase
MTEINLPLYLEKLKTFKPKIIEGYPSTVYILAKYLESKNEIFPVSAILTSSETLYPIQRETIEKVFSCRIFDFYGLAERTVFATECNHHQGHHLNMDYGITEILDGKSEPVPHGKRGWIVGTSLHNMGMPFLRYKTSDISSIKNESCSCGCNYPLMEAVTTKAEDIIVTKDGRFISPSVLTHPFKPMHHIKESQIVQEDEENITIKIVKHEGYSEKDTEQLLASFSSRVGEGMKINLEFVEEIKREANGKFRWVISKVPVNFQ